MMKNTLVYFALMLSNFSVGAQCTVDWSDSIVVAFTPNPITSPRILLLSDSTPLVTWGESASGASQIWCSRFENDSFGTRIGVTHDPFMPSLFGFGGYDVAVSDNQIFVVFEQIQLGIWLAHSDDGGLSFYNANSVQGAVPGGYVTISAVVLDGTGNPVVSYIHDKNGVATYQLRRSPDGGFNFNSPVIGNAYAPGGKVCECCSSDLLASGDSVWLLFRNNNQNLRDIWVSRSTDLASAFDGATDVDATDWQLNFCPIAGPRMARSRDSLITVWMSGASGTSRVYLSTLHAGTMQGGQQLDFPTVSGAQVSQGQADVAAAGDTIGVVFVENGNEILFDFSINGATGLNNQSNRFTVPDHTLQLPSVAFRNGVFHLVYVDATSHQVLYRQGILIGNSPAYEPTKGAVLDISVFPNPVESGGGFWVKSETDELHEISIYDAFGKNIFVQKPGKQEVTVPTNHLPKGVYFLKIRTSNDMVSRKISVN